MSKSSHQQRVEQFMHKANQFVPSQPLTPNAEVRLLRAKLILEEALETILALGVDVSARYTGVGADGMIPVTERSIRLEVNLERQPDLIGIADGCADISVVTIGTLSACGISDLPLLEEVDRSNLDKFELPKCRNEICQCRGVEMNHNDKDLYQCGSCGTYGVGPYRREDGKWVKSKNWQPPNIAKVLEDQSTARGYV